MKINNKTREKNKSIKFNEKLHKYYINKKELISVSQLIHTFFPKFDSEKISLELAKGDLAKQKQLLRDWSMRTRTGTQVHYYLEQFVKTGEMPLDAEIRIKAKDLGTTYEDIKLRFMGGLQFISDMKKEGWTPFIPEWQVYSEMLGIAGTIDLPFINENNEIFLSDYKCTKGIFKKSFVKSAFRGYEENGSPKFEKLENKALTPIEHLDNCNFNIYSLQLTLYKLLIEQEYDYKVVGSVLVHLPPNSSRYVTYETENYKLEVLNMLQFYKEGSL